MILTTRMIHTFLFQSIQSTLTAFSSLFEKPVEEPQFSVELRQIDSKLGLEPTAETFLASMLTLLDHLYDKAADITSIHLPLHDVNISVVSFADCLEMIQSAKEGLMGVIEKLIADAMEKARAIVKELTDKHPLHRNFRG